MVSTDASVSLSMDDNSINHEGKYIYIKNSSYDELESFTNSLHGVLLYYKLAEPETYIIDNFQLPVVCKIDDFGTEQVLSPENGITPVLTSRYGINAVDTLRRLPQRYISAESDNDFLAKLGAAMGGTWTKTYDNQRGNFVYTYTGLLIADLFNELEALKATLAGQPTQLQDDVEAPSTQTESADTNDNIRIFKDDEENAS